LRRAYREWRETEREEKKNMDEEEKEVKQ